jgi:hypothetical protein
MRDALSQLLEISEKSYYVWKKKSHSKLIKLLEYCFTEDEIIEFLETGKITKCENQYIAKNDDLEKYLIDLSFYILKPKLKDIFGGAPLGPNKLYTKGAKEILIDVLKKISPKDTSFTIENAKERLLDRISEEELKWLAIKNPAKKDLLSHYIKENFSNAEILAMVQRSDEIVNFLKGI